MTTTPAPRPVPSPEDRMRDARTDTPYTNRIPVHAGCGHTPEQHRHDDGQNADRRSQDRAVRELLAQLTDAGNTIDLAEATLRRAGHTDPGTSPAELIGRLAAERDRLAEVLRHKRNTITALSAELGDAHDLIAEIRNNRANDDRAFARWETRPSGQQPPSSVPPRRAQEDVAWMNRRAVVSDALGRALTARGYDVPLPVRDRCAETVLAAQDADRAAREG